MALEEITEGASNPVLPLIGEVDLSVQLLVALIVGFMLMAMIRPVSQELADQLGATAAQYLPINPATGQTTDNSPAFGGA